jgi:alginate O-acetyltransferase complex protein AlgI
MIFNTLTYFFSFLFPAAILFRVVRSSWRPWIIVVAGSAFFLQFSYEMAGVAGALCLCLFLWEAMISRFYSPGSRWCFIGIVQSVVLLGIFKYWNFFTGLILPHHASALRWQGAFLPLGISFFTFEFYHYAWDRQHSKTEAGTLGEYLAFILFFPTMVAGPIKRYQDFLPKLRAEPKDWARDFERGITRILAGLVKKFAIADLLTSVTQHLNAHDILVARRFMLPVWLIAYSIKIYIDFSAYSDIAIGSARLFGLHVPENFDWPYLRTNIADFWSHWHMSLTRWLTDYVFIPLGGSRRGPVRVYMNVLATMLISGLWHGAGLNFIVWGLWHGVLLCLHRLWRRLRGEASHSRPLQLASMALTIVLVDAGWAFFAMDLHTAILFYRRLLIG